MRTLRAALLVAVAAMSQTQPVFDGTVILGRPTNRSVVVGVMSAGGGEVFIEYGTQAGSYGSTTGPVAIAASKPLEIALDKLKPNTHYFYRLRYRLGGAAEYAAGEAGSFETQRTPGSAFTFGVQGDSHPERTNSMFHPDLYARTLDNVRRDRPDFYVMLGDDFNVDPLYNRGEMTPEAYARLYGNQRRYLGPMASSIPLFLVNGNHEQAAKYLLNGSVTSPPVLAGLARNAYFPNPAPDAFYTGDAEPVEFVGLPRDYYAWTWGDRFLHRRGNRIPIKWIQTAQVDEFNLHALFALNLLRSLQSPGHNSAISNHSQIGAGMNNLRLAERDHIIRPGIRRAPETFAIQPLVLEKKHGSSSESPWQKSTRILAFKGNTTRSPGICVNTLSPHCE